MIPHLRNSDRVEPKHGSLSVSEVVIFRERASIEVGFASAARFLAAAWLSVWCDRLVGQFLGTISAHSGL